MKFVWVLTVCLSDPTGGCGVKFDNAMPDMKSCLDASAAMKFDGGGGSVATFNPATSLTAFCRIVPSTNLGFGAPDAWASEIKTAK